MSRSSSRRPRVPVDAMVWVALARVADAEGMSRAELVRRALAEWLAEHGSDVDPWQPAADQWQPAPSRW